MLQLKKLWESYSYAIILVVLSFGMVIVFAANTETANGAGFVKIVVKEGDSIWKIASKYSGDHDMSDSDFVKWVERQNGISLGQIYPGDEIIIPVKDGMDYYETNLASSYNEKED